MSNGYNLYTCLFTRSFKIISNTSGLDDISTFSVAWLALNFNLAKVNQNFQEKTIYRAFISLILSNMILVFGLHIPYLFCRSCDSCRIEFWLCLY